MYTDGWVSYAIYVFRECISVSYVLNECPMALLKRGVGIIYDGFKFIEKQCLKRQEHFAVKKAVKV